MGIIKKTPARIAAMEFLSLTDSPVDIEQIINYLRSKNLNTNKVTVYRIIEYFYKQGIVNRLNLQEGKFRYELAKGDHHHLICDNCSKIQDISDNVVPKLEEEINSKHKFLIKRHSLEFFGLCLNCQK
ncbi:transcriptional repressor [Patescibacteria group bacterium]|nr:transcriptional repressor [Patescibacteria group bacterium]